MKSNQNRIKNILFYVMIAIVVLSCIALVYYVKINAVSCMSNPWSYQLKNTQVLEQFRFKSCLVTCNYLPPGYSYFVTEDNSTLVSPSSIDNILKGGITK